MAEGVYINYVLLLTCCECVSGCSKIINRSTECLKNGIKAPGEVYFGSWLKQHPKHDDSIL